MRLHKKILFYVVPYILPKSKANLFEAHGRPNKPNQNMNISYHYERFNNFDERI